MLLACFNNISIQIDVIYMFHALVLEHFIQDISARKDTRTRTLSLSIVSFYEKAQTKMNQSFFKINTRTHHPHLIPRPVLAKDAEKELSEQSDGRRRRKESACEEE